MQVTTINTECTDSQHCLKILFCIYLEICIRTYNLESFEAFQIGICRSFSHSKQESYSLSSAFYLPKCLYLVFIKRYQLKSDSPLPKKFLLFACLKAH